MITETTFFEIKDKADNYGLIGRYKTAEAALQFINHSYNRALDYSFDNCDEEFTVIMVKSKRIKDNDRVFLCEEIVRTRVGIAVFDHEKKEYVFK